MSLAEQFDDYALMLLENEFRDFDDDDNVRDMAKQFDSKAVVTGAGLEMRIYFSDKSVYSMEKGIV